VDWGLWIYSESLQLEIFAYYQVRVYATSMNAQKATPFPINKRRQRVRKRVETCFYQLNDQYKLKSNYVKSFERLKTRIVG